MWQISLGIVLYRFQVANQSHFHHEKPSGSRMKKIPGMQEIVNNTLCSRFDMCQVGSLTEPKLVSHSAKDLKCTRLHKIRSADCTRSPVSWNTSASADWKTDRCFEPSFQIYGTVSCQVCKTGCQSVIACSRVFCICDRAQPQRASHRETTSIPEDGVRVHRAAIFWYQLADSDGPCRSFGSKGRH